MRKFLFFLALFLYMIALALFAVYTSNNVHELVTVSKGFAIAGTGSLLLSICEDITDAMIIFDWLFDLLSHWD